MDLIKIANPPKPSAQLPAGQFGAQAAQWANSAAPAAATLSNTAAGYTTLGGLFRFVPVAGAETDYALFGFQVPTTHRFFCSGVAIGAYVSTALGATLETLQWALGINSTAVSLATTDSGNTFGPRRIALGSQNFAASAAAGVVAPEIVRQFLAPQIIEPGRFLHTILRIPSGTTTGEIRGTVTFDGYFEAAGDVLAGF